MNGSIIDRILSFFNKLIYGESEEDVKPVEEKKAEYLISLDEEALKRLPEMTMKEIQQLRAYAASLESKVRELQEELNKLKGKAIPGLDEEAFNMIKKVAKIMNMRNKTIVYFKFLGRREVVLKAYDGNPIYLYDPDRDLSDEAGVIKGMVLEATDYGPVVYAIVKGKRTKEYFKVYLGSLYNLFNMIYDVDNIVDWLDSGELRVMLTKHGDRLPKVVRVEKGFTDEEADNIVSYYFSDFEDIFKRVPKLRDLFVSLIKKIENLEYELENLKVENREYKMKIGKMKATITALRKALDLNTAETIKAIAELSENQKTIAELTGAYLNTATRLYASESVAMGSLDKIEELSRKLVEEKSKLPEETSEYIADKVAERIKSVVPIEYISEVLKDEKKETESGEKKS